MRSNTILPLLVGDLKLEFVVVIWRTYYQLLCTDQLIAERGGCWDFSGGVNYCLNFSLSPSLSKTNIGLSPWTQGNLPHLSVDNICVNKLLLSIDIKTKCIAHGPPFFFFSNEMVGALHVLCYKNHSYHSWNIFLRKMHSIVEDCMSTSVWLCIFLYFCGSLSHMT